MNKKATPRLKLKNPATGDFDWDQDWWENNYIQDQHPGIRVVNTDYRPHNPWEGQVIYCSDQKQLLLWNGTEWVDL